MLSTSSRVVLPQPLTGDSAAIYGNAEKVCAKCVATTQVAHTMYAASGNARNRRMKVSTCEMTAPTSAAATSAKSAVVVFLRGHFRWV